MWIRSSTGPKPECDQLASAGDLRQAPAERWARIAATITDPDHRLVVRSWARRR
ncbi:MAG: hypothetical protein H6643_12045 [Caldilineaceae bacterium]|nr:hypothetical protein [Caldilineaceae bacterium]